MEKNDMGMGLNRVLPELSPCLAPYFAHYSILLWEKSRGKDESVGEGILVQF